ncbi:MAG: hypothetical protein LJF06_02095 [Gemmatimonadetes bacterium]|jgi:hypothetical protein|nr:hypothetical protein [Gemmatimonadota bacterium]
MTLTNDVHRPSGDGARGLQRGWYALMAVLLIGSAGCSSKSTPAAGPSLPGAIKVNTQTAGFFKDTSYDVLVNGQSKGAIGANAQMTITGLDPATYTVDLGNLTDNCTGQADSVAVAAGDTATVSLGVTCTYTTSTSYTLVYQRDRPDLDSGQITTCSFGFCSTQQGWDLWVDWSSASTPHSIILQNQTTGVEIAHLPGVSLNTLTEADYQGATFTTDTIRAPFDSTRVILIKTDLGNVYALGNPVEDTTAQSLTFDAALIDSIG